MLHIHEIGTISERIIQLVNHFCQGNKAAFGRAADIQSGVLAGIVGGRESKPGFEILQKLLTAYPSVNSDWLLFGKGPMIKGDAVLDSFSDRFYALWQSLTDITLRYEQARDDLWALRGTQQRYANQNRKEEPDIQERIQQQQVTMQELSAKARHAQAEINYFTTLLNSENEGLNVILNPANIFRPVTTSIYRIDGEPDFSKPYDGLVTQRLSTSESKVRQLIEEGRLRTVDLGDEGYRVTELAVLEFLGEAPK